MDCWSNRELQRVESLNPIRSHTGPVHASCSIYTYECDRADFRVLLFNCWLSADASTFATTGIGIEATGAGPPKFSYPW